MWKSITLVDGDGVRFGCDHFDPDKSSKYEIEEVRVEDLGAKPPVAELLPRETAGCRKRELLDM